MVNVRVTILFLFLVTTTLASVLGSPVPEASSRVRRHGADCSKCKWENDDYWEQEEEEEEEEEEEDWDECGDDQEHSKPHTYHGPEKIGGHPPGGSPTYGSHPASPFEPGHGQGSPETGKSPGAHPGSYLDHPATYGNDDSSHVKGKAPQSPHAWPQPSHSPPSYGPKPWQTQPAPAPESDQASRTTSWQNFSPTTPSVKSYHPPAVGTTGASDTITPTHSWSWPNAQGQGDHSGAAAKGRPQHHPDAWDHKPSPSSNHGCVDGDHTGGAPCNQGSGRPGGNGHVTKQAAPTPVDGQPGSAPLNGPEKVQGSPSECSNGGNCGMTHSAPSSPNPPYRGSTAPLNHPTGRGDIPVEVKTQPFAGTSTSFPSQARDRPSSGVPSPANAWNKPVGTPPGIPQTPTQFSHPKDQTSHQPKYGGANTQQTLAPTFGSPNGLGASTPNYPSANDCGSNPQSGGNCKGSAPHSPTSANHPYPSDPRGDNPSAGDGSGCGSSNGKSTCNGGHGGAPLTKNAAPLPNSAGTPLVPPYLAQSDQQPPAYQPQPQLQPQSQLHPQQQSQPQAYPQPQSHPQQPQSQPRPQPHQEPHPQPQSHAQQPQYQPRPQPHQEPHPQPQSHAQQPQYQPRPQPHQGPHPQQQPQSQSHPQLQPQSPPSPGTHGCSQGSCPPAPPDSATGCSAGRCNEHGDKNEPPYVDKISPPSGADSLQTPYMSNPFLNGMISNLSPASDNHMGMGPTGLGMTGPGGPGMLGKGNPFLEGTIRVQPGQSKWSNPTAQDYGKGSPSQPGQPKWDSSTAPDYGKGSSPYPGEPHKPTGKLNPFLGSGQGKPSYNPDITGSHDPNGYSKNANSPNPWSNTTPYGNHPPSVPRQHGNSFGGAAAGAFASAGAFSGAFGSPMNNFAGPQSGFPHSGVGDKSSFGPAGMPMSPYGSYDPYDPHGYPCDNEQQKESPYSGVKGKFGSWAAGGASAYSSASASSWTG